MFFLSTVVSSTPDGVQFATTSFEETTRTDSPATRKRNLDDSHVNTAALHKVHHTCIKCANEQRNDIQSPYEIVLYTRVFTLNAVHVVQKPRPLPTGVQRISTPPA